MSYAPFCQLFADSDSDPVDNSWPGQRDRGYGQESAAASGHSDLPTVRIEVVVVGGDAGRRLVDRQAP